MGAKSTEAAAPLRAAVYCRISSDKTGEGAGVDRQEADCRALAERLGWDVVATYVDNDISAYDRKKVRPAYREMLAAIERGEVRGVVAWHPDRLHRRMTELEGFIDLVESRGLQIQTVRAGQYDLSTASGQMIARILGSVAQGEVAHGRERVKAAKEKAALEGKYRGGIRPFGFQKNGVAVRESEARLIREATAAVLAGRTLAGIAREWDEAGVKTAVGGKWQYGALRDMLIRPRNAGLLAHGLPGRKGQAYDFEEIGNAQWPAIVPEEQWRALVALLTDPSRRINSTTEKKWLGSGIYRCGVPVGDPGKPRLDADGDQMADYRGRPLYEPQRDEGGRIVRCAAVLRVAPHGLVMEKGEFKLDENGDKVRRVSYRCTAHAHLTIEQPQTDERVLKVVADLVRDPRIIGAMQPDRSAVLDADRGRRAVLVRRLEQFEADYSAGNVSGAQLKRATDAVQAELAAVDERLAKGLSRSASSSILSAPDPGKAFLDAPIDVKRLVLAAVVDVEVRPASGRGVSWSNKRLRISTAGEADAAL